MPRKLLIVVLVVAGPAAAQEKKKDEDKIQGTWIVVSHEMVGRKMPAEELKGWKLTLKDGTLTGEKGKDKGKGTYKLDASRKPKIIDITYDEENEKMTTVAIYELKGDTLKLCWSEKVPEHRPTKFASDEESGQTVMVLKREKK
jgi:uncharacterized protein (TIGR03067 family)